MQAAYKCQLFYSAQIDPFGAGKPEPLDKIKEQENGRLGVKAVVARKLVDANTRAIDNDVVQLHCCMKMTANDKVVGATRLV